ncbi:MAG: DUF2834 domain-containing protein [Spirochaetales bacterium]|nr:DUF2834 domain-containing protein [Spirochaetales bacterium]
MKIRRITYLVIAIIGIILPMSQFIPASLDGEFSVGGMLEEMTNTRTLTGVSLDLTVALLAGMSFGIFEVRRQRIRWAWVALLGTFLIGFSFRLPFFLFLREGALQESV